MIADLALRMSLNRVLGICLNHKKTYTSELSESRSAIQEMNSNYYRVYLNRTVQVYAGLKMFDSAIRFRGFEHPYGRLLSYK